LTRPLNFIPADQAFVFDFQQNQHDQPHLAGERGYYLYRKQVHHAARQTWVHCRCPQASGMKTSFTAKVKFIASTKRTRHG
jgi:thiol:disulfide interchange protein